MPFARYSFDLLFIVMFNIIGALFSNTLIAYGPARLGLRGRKLHTLALGLQAMLSPHTSDWHLLMAVATLVTAPLIVLFFIAQRSFVEGITMGGIKA